MTATSGFDTMSQARRSAIASGVERTIGLALSAASIFPSLIWIMLDRRIWPWDQAWYGEVTADLYATLVGHPGLWFDAMRKAIGAKPPLLAWVGQFLMPLGNWLGNVDSVLLLVPLLSHAATLWIVWLTARRLVPAQAWAAVSAVLMLASAPLFVGMSHQYLVEAPQALVVAASFLLVLSARGISLFRLGALLLTLCMAGLAIKTTTPLYCALAWGIAGVIWLLRLRTGERAAPFGRLDVALGVASAALTVLTIAWYVTNVLPMVAHIRDSTLSDVAVQYGSRGPLLSKLGFWLAEFNSAMFLLPYLAPLGLLAATFIAASAIRNAVRADRSSGEVKRPPLQLLVMVAALLQIYVFLLVVSVQVAEETRYLAALLPVVAIVLVWTFAQLAPTWMLRILSLLMLAQLVAVQLEAHGRIGRLSTSAWLLPVNVSSNDREVADALAHATCPMSLKYRYVVVGPEWPGLNANSLAMYSARMGETEGYRCYYTGLGYAEKDAKRALDRIDSLNASYIILPRADDINSNPNFLNLVLRPVYDSISLSNRYSQDGREFGPYRIYRRIE